MQQLYSQPNAPFAVALYCGDALGNQIAVLHYPHDHQLKHADPEPSWMSEPLVWFDEIWSMDVTSFAWAPDGRHLFVATSSIYGSGGVFDLDLKSRTFKQINPLGISVSIDNPGQTFVITGMDLNSALLSVAEVAENPSAGEAPKRFTLPTGP